MSDPDIQSLLVAQLTQRLASPETSGLLAEVLQDPAAAALRWEYRQLTLLCAEATVGPFAMGLQDFAAVVDRHDGWVDPSCEGLFFAAFPQPENAMGAATDLQLRTRRGQRIGLLKGLFLVGRFEAGRRSWCTLTESAALRVVAVAARAGVGSIQTTGETHSALEAGGEREWGLVTTEFVDSRQVDVSITLPPPAWADESTFAGLGRG